MIQDKIKTKPIVLKILFTILFVLFVFLLGVILGSNLQNLPQKIQKAQFRLSENYTFTNPLLDCEIDRGTGEIEYRTSIKKVKAFINTKINNNEIEYAAVYFRDLNNGPWFGINEKELFIPASLLKLPIMIAILKKSESDPRLLHKKIMYENKFPEEITQNFIPKKQLIVGQKYTISDLVYRMIVYSDNQSLYLLAQNIDQKNTEKVLKDLNVEYLIGDDLSDYVSVKSYATLFRVLYNSSYLNRDSSEKALGMLTKVIFNKGLLKGIPKDTTVAHKFGEREIINEVKQLHDCGIVYYPKHPYILCVMTKGQNWDNLSTMIGDISKEIYSNIDNKNNE